jgi:hypothetical protein
MTRYRQYDRETDRAGVYRILREVGWLEAGKEEPWDAAFACSRASVAEVNGEPESVVATIPGTMLYLEQELPLAEINAVATSRIARQRGLTKGLVAHALARAVAEGAILSRVCVFDQGYYNQTGFGSGGYEHTLTFDPLTLRIDKEPRVPRRLGADDAELIHASRLTRWRVHGGANYPAVGVTAVELLYAADKGFGVGYCDGPNGELTHHFWCVPEQPDHGPYGIQWMAYQTGEQFLELMAVIKSLGDQVQMVRMREPAGIQLQDFVRRPFRQHRATEHSRYENRNAAYAFWQVRVCDLPRCLAATHLDCGEVRFNLRLSDPIERLLEHAAPWRGVAGEYVVTLGPQSNAKPGADAGLPTLTASVNAFSRMWLGVRPATGLAVTDDLDGPPALLTALDQALRLPEPKPDWDF